MRLANIKVNLGAFKRYILIESRMTIDAYIFGFPIATLIIFGFMVIHSGDGRFSVDMTRFGEYWIETLMFPLWFVFLYIRRDMARRIIDIFVKDNKDYRCRMQHEEDGRNNEK